MKTSFFHHLITRTLIENNWNYNTPERIFFDALPDKVKDRLAYSIEGTELKMAESDIMAAAEGTPTPAFKEFFKELYRRVKDTDPGVTVMMSMHSGSSDYFFVKDLRGMVESWKK